jgi:hypothetical protein
MKEYKLRLLNSHLNIPLRTLQPSSAETRTEPIADNLRFFFWNDELLLCPLPSVTGASLYCCPGRNYVITSEYVFRVRGLKCAFMCFFGVQIGVVL